MAKGRTVRAKTMRSRKGEAQKRPPARIGDGEKGFYIAVLSFAFALTAMLAHGANFDPTFSFGRWSTTTFGSHRTEPVAKSAIYARAMELDAKFDSRPYWHNSKLVAGEPTDRPTADLAIEHLIPCESGGKAIDHLDSNGKMSYGILQFQDWSEWERVSGISGNPENSDDSIRMAEWGIEHGMINHWGCARILGEIQE
jgi:hypothetical protein